jgi:hypothetical protein
MTLTKTTPITLLAALLVLTPQFTSTAVAQDASRNIYRWTDQNGKVHYTDLLPPGNEVKYQKLTKGGKAPEPEPSYLIRKAVADFPVTLYTTDNCKKLCDDARGLLNKRRVPFSEAAIKDDAALTDFRQRFGAEAVIPVLTVGTTALQGFEADSWNHQLNLAGYPKQ